MLEHAAENRSGTKGRECNRGLKYRVMRKLRCVFFFPQILLIIDSHGSGTCRVRATCGAFVKLTIYLVNLHKRVYLRTSFC